MAEIILNPDVEIIHDEDRKLYWHFRQVMDTRFLGAIDMHIKECDHCYHICFNQYLDVRQLSLKQFVDQQSQQHTPKEVLEQMLKQTGDELIEAITNLIAVHREFNRRGMKIK